MLFSKVDKVSDVAKQLSEANKVGGITRIRKGGGGSNIFSLLSRSTYHGVSCNCFSFFFVFCV